MEAYAGTACSVFNLKPFRIGSPKKPGSKCEESVETHHSGSQSREIPRYRVSFAEMQRMHLRKLQIKLVKHAVYMYKDGREAENSTWEKDLAEYSR